MLLFDVIFLMSDYFCVPDESIIASDNCFVKSLSLIVLVSLHDVVHDTYCKALDTIRECRKLKGKMLSSVTEYELNRHRVEFILRDT